LKARAFQRERKALFQYCGFLEGTNHAFQLF
jgi:hypothetical protein